MKQRLLPTIGILVIMVLVTGTGISIGGNHGGQGNNANISIDNENIAISITGGQNVPKFTFWEPGENNTKYRVQFSNIFEVVDSNDNGQFDTGEDSMVPKSQQALASWNWDFSDVTRSDGETVFNITGDGSPSPVMGEFDLKFVNHLADNASEFKFDVIIDNYNFVSDDDNAMLVLAFMLTAADGDDEAENEGDDTVAFGDGVMSIEETAEDADGSIDVGITAPSNNSARAYISYEKFSGRMVHDPTLAINGGGLFSSLPFNTNSFLFAFVAIIPVAIYIRRKR